MRKLPIYAKTLLLEGASTLGNFTDGFYYIEEKVKAKDYAELLIFCKWVDDKIGGASTYNIDMLFSAFKNPEDQYLAKQASNLAELIKQHKPRK